MFCVMNSLTTKDFGLLIPSSIEYIASQSVNFLSRWIASMHKYDFESEPTAQSTNEYTKNKLERNLTAGCIA